MKFFKPTLVAIALVGVIGCQQEAKEEVKVAVALETEEQKQAYGLGASIGMYMERNLEEQAKLGLALDKELIVRGFVESVEGNSAIPKEEIQTLLSSLDATMKAKQEELTVKEAEALSLIHI